MIGTYGAVVEAVHAVSPDAWVLCETYTSFAPSLKPEGEEFGTSLSEAEQAKITSLPEDAVIHWVLDRALYPETTHDWRADVHPPTKENIARIHAGSQWCGDGIEGWGVQKIGDLVSKARACGLNGVSIFGEESPVSPPNEANYLVFAEFNGFGNPNPECDIALFYSQTLDPLYGGVGMALRWQRLYAMGHFLRQARKQPISWKRRSMGSDLTGDPDYVEKAKRMSSSERREQTVKLAEEAHSIASTLSGDTCRRWSWLENWLWRAEYLHRTDVW
jgi:hypothetical protein